MSDFRVSLDGSFIEYEGRFWTPQEWLDRKPLADQLLREWLDLDLSDSKARYSLMLKTANYLRPWANPADIRTESSPRRSPMSEWHKIETAPKDGTDILLWRSRTRFGREVNPPIVAGWFSNGDEAGWSSHEQPDKWIDGEPTYWMPLPDPPRDHP